MHTELPQPSADALEHSDRLARLLHERIAAHSGWISFRDYMQAALYEPGLGYYSAGAVKFGEAGDFVTAPEISPLFSRCLARQCDEVLAELGGGDVLELGGGSGRMAADMLLEFARMGALPDRYLILEPSADLRDRQGQLLQALPPELHTRVSWLDALPDEPLRGVIVGNEVVDALSVQRFVIDDAAINELGVVSDGERFDLAGRPADASLAAAVRKLGLDVDAGYTSEICASLSPWVAALSTSLAAGAIMLLDYGYSRQEYYLPERRSGTLRCYYRHRAHENALLWPGLQDITAWVDFTALTAAAEQADLQVAGYTTQAHFLVAAGIEQLVEELIASDTQLQVAAARGLRQLMLPGEMGDTVKVMAMTRGVAAPGGFAGRDMRAALSPR